MRRVYWRLVPLLFAMMYFNYLNRINVGYAALQMNADIGLGPAAFGFGASIFFLGYMLFEIPSNTMLHKYGARVWLSGLLICWGFVAAATSMVWDPTSFYVMRFALGIAEAGLMPGLAFYVSLWFPARYRGRAVAGYVIAGAIAAVTGPPVSTVLMSALDERSGLHGWQWMLIAEAVPTILLGIILLWRLSDRPDRADWLPEQERAWLVDELRQEQSGLPDVAGHAALWHALSSVRVWLLGVVFACSLVGTYGLLFWLPQVIKSVAPFSDVQVGLLSSVPALVGVCATIIAGRLADSLADARWLLVGVLGAGAFGLLGCAISPAPIMSYLFMCIAAASLSAASALIWRANTLLMRGAAAAVSIALVGTIAQLGGLAGPWLIGIIKERSEGYGPALATVAAFLACAALVAASARLRPIKVLETGAPRSEAAPA
jgi:MFS family permease